MIVPGLGPGGFGWASLSGIFAVTGGNCSGLPYWLFLMQKCKKVVDEYGFIWNTIKQEKVMVLG